MDMELVQYFIGVAVTATVALLWRIDRTLAISSTKLQALQQQFNDHSVKDEHTFASYIQKIESVRDEQRRVQSELSAATLQASAAAAQAALAAADAVARARAAADIITQAGLAIPRAGSVEPTK